MIKAVRFGDEERRLMHLDRMKVMEEISNQPRKTESLIDKPMILNSLICKLINVQANMNENNEKKIINSDEISKLINAFPRI